AGLENGFKCGTRTDMIQARKFFVGGNFKMNGSLDGIKAIIQGLNDAKLNPNVGESTLSALSHPHPHLSPSTPPLSQNPLTPPPQQRSSSLPPPSTSPTPATSSARTSASPPRTSTTRATARTPVRPPCSKSLTSERSGLSSATLSVGPLSAR